jgi:hypothetical protein
MVCVYMCGERGVAGAVAAAAGLWTIGPPNGHWSVAILQYSLPNGHTCGSSPLSSSLRLQLLPHPSPTHSYHPHTPQPCSGHWAVGNGHYRFESASVVLFMQLYQVLVEDPSVARSFM